MPPLLVRIGPLLLVSHVVGILGCAGGEPNRAVHDAQSSPRETHEKFREGLRRNDWEAVYAALSPQSRDLALFGMLAWGPGAASERGELAAFRAVFAKHGLDLDQMGERLFEYREADADVKLRETLPPAEKRQALLADLLQWHIDHVPSSEFAEFAAAKVGPLEELTMDGEKAVGRHRILSNGADGPANRLRPVTFQQIDRTWYIDLGAPDGSGAASKYQTDDVPPVDSARGQ